MLLGTSSLMMVLRTTMVLNCCQGRKSQQGTSILAVPAIDNQMSVLALFFWELVHGLYPAGSLLFFHLATQIACEWGLLMIEGLRYGNRWSLVSLWVPLGPRNQDTADGKKHCDMGPHCAEHRICCHHTSLVHGLSFDIAYGLFKICIPLSGRCTESCGNHCLYGFRLCPADHYGVHNFLACLGLRDAKSRASPVAKIRRNNRST